MSEDTEVRLAKAQKFVQDLESRGLIANITNRDDLINALAADKKVYFGIDPTADFLHLGHYLPLVIIKRFLEAEYKAVIIIGGMTAQIGDPSFRSKDRTYSFDVASNSENLKGLINLFFEKFFSSKQSLKNNLKIVNNLDFLSDSVYKRDAIIWFLRDVCSHIKISELIHKDFIKDRLENGLTLSEFSYPALQAWDFLYLSQAHDVFIQIGGSDQWTNILTGKDLIDKKGKSAIKPVGFTFPILSDSEGRKFGKSDGNAIKIFDKKQYPEILSFGIFQYLINLDDKCVISYSKMLTFIDPSEIDIWSENIRLAKKQFAYEICKDIYGSDIADNSRNVSSKLFSEDVMELSAKDVLSVAISSPNSLWNTPDAEISLMDACLKSRLVSSKSEFKRLWSQKGINVFWGNNREVKENDILGFSDCIKPFAPGISSFGFIMLKRGQKSFCMMIFLSATFDINNKPLLS